MIACRSHIAHLAAGALLALLSALLYAADLPQGASSWEGQYDYPDGRPSVNFELRIDTQGSSFTGGTKEPATFGDGSSPFLTANVSGSASSSRIHFTKTMDGSGGQHHSIEYNGTLSADGRSMSGRWSIGPNWSGTFSAHLVAASDHCDVCEQALANDVLAGIDGPMPDTYVRQSLGKYENCARRQPGQCAAKCAAIMRDTVQSCLGKFNDNGLRSCEKSGIQGFRENVAPNSCTH